MFLMDYKERTKAQLLQDIAEMHKQKGEWKALERECRMQAEELQSLNVDIDRQKKDLEILHTITDAVHQSFNLQHIYTTALDLATTLQDIDMAFIYLISEDRKGAVLQAHRNLTEDYIHRAGRIPYPKGVTWKVLNSGQVLNIEDIQKDKDIGLAGKDMGHRRALGTPIILEGIVMGVIWLASFKKGKFSEQEIELNVSIGNHIGIAIAKAKLYEEMEARVSARTAELEKTNLRLKQQIEERKRAENEIRIVREKHEVVNAIKNILKDEQYITSSIAEKLAGDVEEEIAAQKPPHEALSNREYKVMIMLSSGKSIKDIAAEIYLSPSTVSTYRARVLQKLNLETTAELIRYAIKHNLTV
jgi:DNA-binding CsgD family transcriptional regulator/putative methionine-R-sulfoxide reductase with GAF domain